jgi:hypothetical protein
MTFSIWIRLALIGLAVGSIIATWLNHRDAQKEQFAGRVPVDPEHFAKAYFSDSPARQSVAVRFLTWLSYRPEAGSKVLRLRPDDDLLPLGLIGSFGTTPQLYAEDLGAAFGIPINPAELERCRTIRQFVDFLHSQLSEGRA